MSVEILEKVKAYTVEVCKKPVCGGNRSPAGALIALAENGLRREQNRQRRLCAVQAAGPPEKGRWPGGLPFRRREGARHTQGGADGQKEAEQVCGRRSGLGRGWCGGALRAEAQEELVEVLTGDVETVRIDV